VVAVGGAGRWLLMREAAGRSLRASARLADWVQAAYEYGRLPRALAGAPSRLRLLRGRRRDLGWLARQIAPMLADPRGLAAGGGIPLTRGEIPRPRGPAAPRGGPRR